MVTKKSAIILLTALIPLGMFCSQEENEHHAATHMAHQGEGHQHGEMMNMDTLLTHMHNLQGRAQKMMVWQDYQQEEIMMGHGETMERMMQNMNAMGQNMQQFMENMNRMFKDEKIMKNEQYRQHLGSMQEHMNQMMSDYAEMLSTVKEFQSDSKE